MHKKHYFIVLSSFIVILLALIGVYLMQDQTRSEDIPKVSEEYLEYTKIFDLKLDETNNYYSIVGLKKAYRNVHTLTIPDTIDDIPVKKLVDEHNSFSNYRNIQAIVIGKNIEYLGTKLDDEGILNGGTYGDDFMASSPSSLANIVVNEENKVYSSLNGVLYNKDKTVLIKYPYALSTESASLNYTLIDSVKEVYNGAFYLNPSLSSINFNNCETIGANAFYGCANLNKITLTSSVKTIGAKAFYKCGLGNITIPNSITQIGSGAFAYNTLLTSVIIDLGECKFGTSIFTRCDDLIVYTKSEDVNKLANNEAFKNVTIKSLEE